jgi:hypothetical protein
MASPPTLFTSLPAQFDMTPSPTLFTSLLAQFDMPTNGQLRYIGMGEVVVHVAFSYSGSQLAPVNSLLKYLFQLCLNGNAIPGGGFKHIFDYAKEYLTMPFHKACIMNTSDYISFYVTNQTAFSSAFIYNVNIVAASVPNQIMM